MAQNINSVVLVGNLTKDPELRHTPSGTAVTTLRLAVNDRVKRGEEWQDAAYYFDITVWGRDAENCAQYLAKGRPVGVQGKLTWREWDAQDGTKRQSVEVTANTIQFLGGRDGGGADGGGGGGQFVPQGASQPASGQASADFPSSAADDDIPF
ncbi:MAG TPA: single-stranded DNA-binding protein [Gaiellaceae bacterium]|nr:single-stranded DNA-binding protein [Gaiellaceae bacterium]